jgi:DNA-binding transcriptional ArsR family regulator
MSRRRTERSLAGAALLFAALGDPTRLALLQHLSVRGPASISLLAERFQTMTRQGVTKHLQVLASAGVIAGSRQGREHVWTVDAARLAEARRHLEVIARGWDSALARLKDHVEKA